jgi:purine-binding chemotaxis protein CheW
VSASVEVGESLVGFLVGDVTYAVPISHVREVVAPAPLTALPHAPSAVAGVMDHRGQVITVVDLRARFGLGAAPDHDRARWILLEVGGRGVGLIADSVLGVLPMGAAGLRPPPSLGGGDEERALLGVSSHAGRMVFVLDVMSFELLTRSIHDQKAWAAPDRS